MYCDYCGSWNGGVNQKCRNCLRPLGVRVESSLWNGRS